MKTVLKTLGYTAASLLLAVAIRTAFADEPASPPSAGELVKALAEAGKPGAEHRKLQPFVGQWNFTMKLWTDPNQPPAEMKGTIERQWIMGGRFIQETARGQCAQSGREFEGMGLLGYDAAQKKFTCTKACGLSGTVSSGLASCDSTGTRFESVREEHCPLAGQKVRIRDEVVIESNDRIVMTMYGTHDAREVKIAELVSTRQK
jgi:hypothetical protein